MPSILRSISAGVAGVLTAFVTVAAVEAIAHMAVPRGPMPDPADRAAVATYIAGMPTSAFAAIALAWFLAVLAGTWVAAAIARGRPRFHALLVGGVIALSAVLNFALIPHPTWFVVAGLAAVAVATLLAMRMASRRAPRADVAPA